MLLGMFLLIFEYFEMIFAIEFCIINYESKHNI